MRFPRLLVALLLVLGAVHLASAESGGLNIQVQNGAVAVTGQVAPANGGTGANNTATTGRFLKGDGANFVTSSGSAGGTGSCTLSLVSATNSDAAPTCNAGPVSMANSLAHANLGGL